MSNRFTFIAALLLCASVASGAFGKPYPPFDDGPKDPSFFAFREQLKVIVAKQDLKTLTKHLDRDAVFRLDGSRGKASAIRWMKDEPLRWRILARILRRGGCFFYDRDPANKSRKRKHFLAPYTACADPESKRGFELGIITATGVNLRARPSKKAPVISRLNYDEVQLLESNRTGKVPQGWVAIKTLDGRRGFVHRRYIATGSEFRAIFVKRKGRWLLSIYANPDR